MEDRELVRKLLAKDAEAYRYFYGAYRERIYRICVVLLGYQDPDAEDVTQEVFLAALKQLPQFEFRSTLYYWLHRICTYLCYERIRKRKRQVVSLNEDLEAVAGPMALTRLASESHDEKERQMLALVESQKQSLGEPCRNLLDLRMKEKRTYGELAEILKVPIGTVNSRLARCLEALRNLVNRALKEGRRG
ncbi:MAG TPA: RNA polymerase sigma factor [bacterium]|nr:RNA polymerase sigma factor [bacterium]